MHINALPPLHVLTPEEEYVTWAALEAMVNDIHAPQDNLRPWGWKAAKKLVAKLCKNVEMRKACLR